MEKQKRKKYVISGGGTGGHIYPAIAIANALKAANPDCEILFIGAKGKMEMTKVPQAGFPIKGLWISGINRSFSPQLFLFPLKLVVSLITAFFTLLKFKPDAVIGVGGYASGPSLRMANLLGINTFIQEQNSYPGITNKILSKKAHKIFVAYPGLEKFFPAQKILLTGNPVRKDILKLEGKKERAKEQFKINNDWPTILVIGGSLGARSINHFFRDHLEEVAALNVNVVWQCGKLFDIPKDLPAHIQCMPFIEQMDLAYSLADIIVSRAGALSVSEIALVKKPAILVPFPYASEDHQTKNAEALVNKGAALMVKDDQLNADLMPALKSIIEDESKRDKMVMQLEGFGYPDSAEIIANEIIVSN